MADGGAMMSTEELMMCLAELIRSDTVSTGDRLKAIDMMNKMRLDDGPRDVTVRIHLTDLPGAEGEKT